jgi:hypothetical protein
MNIVLIVATFRRTLASVSNAHRTQFIYEVIRIEARTLIFSAQKLNDGRKIEAPRALAGE